MTKPKNATDDEILGEHLPYELWMLRATYEKLSVPIGDIVLRNALIESFCLHARLLLEFFNNKQGKRAQEFTGGTYSAAHLSSLKKAERHKLNTQIAHLTGERATDASEKIDQDLRRKFLTALEKEATHFAGQLEERFKPIFKRPTAAKLSGGASPPSATNAPIFLSTSSE